MVFIQNRLRFFNLDIVLGALAPGQTHQPIDVRPRDRVLRSLWRHLGQPVQLLLSLLLRFLRHASLIDPFLQLLDLHDPFVLLAQFFLNRLHLLTEEIFLLTLFKLALHLRLDLAPQFQQFQFLVKIHQEPYEPILDVQRL